MAEIPRVLHVLGDLGMGGAETWACQLFPRMDPARIKMEFLVHARGGAYEERLLGLGARIHALEGTRRPIAYELALRRLLKKEGPFLAVHSHIGYFSGLVVRAAHKEGVPGRIVHSRNTRDGHSNSLARGLYRWWMRRWMLKHATVRLAVSREAAVGLFGDTAGGAGQCDVVTGIDFSPFAEPPDRGALRRLLDLPERAKVVGHLGSFRRQKNHALFVEVAKHLAPRDETIFFVLIGEGPLRAEIEASVREAGLSPRFRFAGDRAEALTLLRGMDAFLFPSLYEGLPRALMEAQAAGLPCVASDAISPVSAAFPGAVRFLSLGAPVSEWVEAAVAALAEGWNESRGARAVRAFSDAGLTIEANARYLTTLYEGMAHAAIR